jgi:hypothetical protein
VNEVDGDGDEFVFGKHRERTVYLIFDRECANVSTFYELLKNAKPSRSSICELQANLTASNLSPLTPLHLF